MTSHKTGRGLCQNHYALLRRNGTTKPTKFAPRRTMTLADVLHIRSEPRGDCVIWTGGLTTDGYPVMVKSDGTGDKGHRASWALANGPIPKGMTLDHVCHTTDPNCPGGKCIHRRCINPDHLEPVTQAENGRRQWIQRRAHAQVG